MSAAHVLCVADYIAKPCVQSALLRSMWVPSILSFFFGVDFNNQSEVDQMMRKGACMDSMKRIWWEAEPQYDEICYTKFSDAVRVAGRGELLKLEENLPFQNTVDGVMAEMILCDQTARNAFRGTEEAFAYEDKALQSSRLLTEAALSTSTCPTLTGEIYPPYLSFMIVTLMHSESIKDHDDSLALLQYAREKSPGDLSLKWDYQQKTAHEHKTVVERFGRYPHRNHLKGRPSTLEEKSWLSDVENLPGWAKSQLKQ